MCALCSVYGMHSKHPPREYTHTHTHYTSIVMCASYSSLCHTHIQTTNVCICLHCILNEFKNHFQLNWMQQVEGIVCASAMALVLCRRMLTLHVYVYIPSHCKLCHIYEHTNFQWNEPLHVHWFYFSTRITRNCVFNFHYRMLVMKKCLRNNNTYFCN